MALKINFNKATRKLSLEEITDLFYEAEFISEIEKESIKKKNALSKKHPLVILYEHNIKDRRNPEITLDLEGITKVYATFIQMDYFHIDSLKIEIDKVTKILPKAYVKRLGVLPVAVDNETVTFATCEPFWLDWIGDVERSTKKKVKLVISSPTAISTAMEDFYTVQKAIKNLGKNMGVDGDGRRADIDKLLGQGNSLVNSRDESGVSGVVDWLFQFAYDERATDIHLEPKSGQGIVRFRVDGRLRTVYKIDGEIFLSVLSRLKILADMKVDEKRRPQDGRIKRQLDEDRLIEIRSSTIPTHYGEKLVMRIFDPKMADSNLQSVGFEGKDLEVWKNLISQSYGMVLVTGPTGSGKSTTLHATLKEIAKPEVNVCTAEDPVEIINDDFNQMQINSEIDLNFAQAIKSFMRQDPDVIMVGEIRDKETSEMAIQASLTGHMVFSTLHTNDALSTITRLIDLGVPPHLINASLKGLLAQRLVRVLCPYCKKKVPTSEHLWKTLCSPYKMKMPEYTYEPVGCTDCKDTGYKGRQSIYELVLMNDALRGVINKSVEITDLIKVMQGKYTPMNIFGAKKVIGGITDINEVLRVII
ncbi:MAG: type II/IV secretion system protein [Oligoflexia bacterium]|nr:type II/IV secretion system protein [Oligoflexia bacterium]